MAHKSVLSSLFLVHVEKEILLTSICLHMMPFALTGRKMIFHQFWGGLLCVVIYVNLPVPCLLPMQLQAKAKEIFIFCAVFTKQRIRDVLNYG